MIEKHFYNKNKKATKMKTHTENIRFCKQMDKHIDLD